MGWKEWSYWLKGGLILSIIALVFRLTGGMFELFPSSNPLEKFLGSASFFFGYPFGIPLANLFNTGIVIIDITIFLGIYFIIGAFIGWIYGKIKNRKLNSQ